MALSQTYFENSRNFTLNNVQFTNVTAHDSVSTILREEVASGAIFDSAERFASGKCHPGTRKRVIEQITTWINDPDPAAHRILWIHGPAGSGKSALAHTICELLIESYPAQYGGSFFFARDSPDRRKALKPFTTLAYQLAIRFPSMRSEINDVLHRDPSLPTKSVEIQLLSLIAQSLLSCQTLSFPNPVLIIDGLDECADDEGLDTQLTTINLIAKSIVEHNLPLRFIIASRPEAWIRDAFETSPLPNITLALSLRDDVDADKDIKTYLTDEFEKIRLGNRRIMGAVEPPWPPTDVINHFVYEASGQYVYASTVLKFVGKYSRFSNPQEQLRILTSPGPHRASAFSELDRLYATILSAYSRWETMRRVLGGILFEANTTIIEVVLGVDPNEVVLVLDALSSIITIEKPNELSEEELLVEPIFGSLLAGRDRIKFCHLSFREFLENENRSGVFYVDLHAVQKEIVREFFEMIHRNLDQNYEQEPYSFLNIDIATYHSVMAHVASQSFRFSSVDTVTVLPLMTRMTERLLVLDPIGEQMNYLSCFLGDMGWIVTTMSLCLADLADRPDLALDKHRELNEYEIECQKLQDAAILVRKRAVSTLSESLPATPTLVYLIEYALVSTSIYDLFELRGRVTVADVLYTLEQYRNIIHLALDPDDRYWCIYTITVTDNDFLYQENGEDKEWRTEGKWRDLRISFARQFIELALKRNHFFYNDPDDFGKQFFGSKSISDIHNKEYFQNADSLNLLPLMADISAWTTLISTWGPWHPDRFISEVLCWFNRQLTNVQTLRLLNEHDKALPQKMTRVAKEIFDHCFLLSFRPRP